MYLPFFFLRSCLPWLITTTGVSVYTSPSSSPSKKPLSGFPA